MLPHKAKVIRDGSFIEIPTAELVPGDLVSLEAGDLVSADCRLVEAFAMRVNNATITGESLPKGRSALPSDTDDALHSQVACAAGRITGLRETQRHR